MSRQGTGLQVRCPTDAGTRPLTPLPSGHVVLLCTAGLLNGVFERLWKTEEEAPTGDRLDVFSTLVEAYEEARFPIDMPDPIEAIKFRLAQQGEDKNALVGIIGSRPRVYEVLRRDRALSLAMIRLLNKRFRILADVLIRPVRKRKKKQAG